jgi:MerR family mercuric resistance operon transcriptional regulator
MGGEKLTISRLAELGGVNQETVRYYEREGLLAKPPRTASGYRVFPPEAARRLRFIKRAQELGFSLSEIRDLLSLRVDKRTTPADVRKRAETKIADVGEKIRTLTRIKDALRTLSEQCSACGTLDECPILQTLDDVTDSEAMKR